MTESPKPAGWYHAQGDPTGTYRYWDGSTWFGEPRRFGDTVVVDDDDEQHGQIELDLTEAEPASTKLDVDEKPSDGESPKDVGEAIGRADEDDTEAATEDGTEDGTEDDTEDGTEDDTEAGTERDLETGESDEETDHEADGEDLETDDEGIAEGGDDVEVSDELDTTDVGDDLETNSDTEDLGVFDVTRVVKQAETMTKTTSRRAVEPAPVFATAVTSRPRRQVRVWRARSTRRRFWSSLFDVSFSASITQRAIPSIFIGVLAIVGVAAVAAIVVALSQGLLIGLIASAIIILVALFVVVLTRLVLEFFLNQLRQTEVLEELVGRLRRD